MKRFSHGHFPLSAIGIVAASATASCGPNNGSGSSAAVTVSPASANVLTCSTSSFSESPATAGTWSVTPATGSGSIDATGSYTAPAQVPPNAGATVTFTASPASASAAIRLGTAFPGTPSTQSFQPDNEPSEHLFSAHGSRVYAGVPGPANSDAVSLTFDLLSSSDSGKTFGAPVSYHTGNLSCVTAALDAGDPDVVYVVYEAGHGDSTSNTGDTVRLVVSQDGGRTFPVEYVVEDDPFTSMLCPDVVSPSPDHVIVAGVASNESGQSWVATYVSAHRGADIGPVGTTGVAVGPTADSRFASSADTNLGSASACAITRNGNGYGPRIASNGQGATCIVYQYTGCPNGNEDVVAQCSGDGGGTWTAPLALQTVPYAGSVAKVNPTAAVSPGGTNVAVTFTDDTGEVQVYFSTDSGHTFGRHVGYPAGSRTAINPAASYTGFPTVAWENDRVLWLAQSVEYADNIAFLMIDKTCDDGATWSGALDVGDGYVGAGLVLTSSGMVAGAVSSRAPQAGATIALAP